MNEAIRGDGRPVGQASQDRPIGEIARKLPEQVTRLVREELRLAELIVGGGLLAVAAALAGFGRKQVQKATPPMPQQATESIKADLDEIKERAQR